MTNPITLYIGKREAVITEVGGTADMYEGKYLVAPVGDAEYDCYGAFNKAELSDLIDELKAAGPGVEIVRC